MKDKTMNTTLIAGLLSGIAGLLVFLTIHHFWIKPIWFILPPGLVIAALGGLAIGWSYAEIKAGLPPRPWTSLAVFVLVTTTLTPAILLAQLRPPLIDISTGVAPDGKVGIVIARFVIELLLTATAVGGLVGWWLGHTGRAALATALAGFVFALGPGHNIPFLGNTPAVGKGIVLLVIIIFISAAVLVESQAELTRQR
jgi:hypothetical protein